MVREKIFPLKFPKQWQRTSVRERLFYPKTCSECAFDFSVTVCPGFLRCTIQTQFYFLPRFRSAFGGCSVVIRCRFPSACDDPVTVCRLRWLWLCNAHFAPFTGFCAFNGLLSVFIGQGSICAILGFVRLLYLSLYAAVGLSVNVLLPFVALFLPVWAVLLRLWAFIRLRLCVPFSGCFGGSASVLNGKICRRYRARFHSFGRDDPLRQICRRSRDRFGGLWAVMRFLVFRYFAKHIIKDSEIVVVASIFCARSEVVNSIF